MARILVVDDERVVVDTLKTILSRAGFEVLVAWDGEAAVRVATQESPDLLILDVVLPKIDGVEVCRVLRQRSRVPILMLTAMGDQVDKVLGLESGADDYLTKPFDALELLARVRALLRRAGVETPPTPAAWAGIAGRSGMRLQEGELQIDLLSRRAALAGIPLNLTPKEFDLLAFLVHHRGQICSQRQLLKEVWGYDDPLDTRTVMVHIRSLREKLEDDPSRPRFIETVRGAGYKFSA